MIGAGIERLAGLDVFESAGYRTIWNCMRTDCQETAGKSTSFSF